MAGTAEAATTTTAGRGLMMGRFQPFHLGHLDLARQVLEECGEAIIAVTSSQFNYIQKDPFTAGERVEMIHGSLLEAQHIDSGRCLVVPVENQFNVATWLAYLRSALPRFDRVYSGNPYVAMLLADSGIRVARPAFLDRDRYRSTRIRSMMAAGGSDDWKGLVPNAVAEFLEGINAADRLRTIAGSDTDPTGH